MDEELMLSKREALESMLGQGDVLIQLDPRREGVRVPNHLADQPLLVLRIGLDMPVPIPDLRVHAFGVEGTLSFNREPHHVTVPWDAIFGMVSEAGRGLLWSADVPSELFEQVMQLRARGESRDPPAAPDPPKRRRFVALDGGRRDDPATDTRAHGLDAEGAHPHLRLVD